MNTRKYTQQIFDEIVRSGPLDDFGYARISSMRFKRITNSYKRDLDYLAENGFIKSNHSYSNRDGLCKGYMPIKQYGQRSEPAITNRFHKKVRSRLELFTLPSSVDYYDMMDEKLWRMKYWEGVWRSGCRGGVTGRKGDRLYHIGTSTPRLLREQLTVDGKPIGCIDIKSCQPFFLGCMSGDEDMRRDVREERFYSELSEYKDKAKELWGRIFLAPLDKKWHKSRKSMTHVLQRVEGNYPVAWDYSCQIRKKRKSSIAKRLQKMEADFMVYTVLPKLFKKGVVCFPVHDAIYACQSDLEVVKEIVLVSWGEFKKDGWPEIGVSMG